MNKAGVPSQGDGLREIRRESGERVDAVAMNRLSRS